MTNHHALHGRVEELDLCYGTNAILYSLINIMEWRTGASLILTVRLSTPFVSDNRLIKAYDLAQLWILIGKVKMERIPTQKATIHTDFTSPASQQASTKQVFPFLALPPEIQGKIISYTHLRDRRAIQTTCNDFNNIGNIGAVLSSQIINSLTNRYPDIINSPSALIENPALRTTLAEITGIDLTGKPKFQSLLARYLQIVPENCTRTLEGHAEGILCMAVLPDGRLVTGAWDNTLKVWDLNQTNEPCTHMLEGHTDGILCVAVLPDGRLVSGSRDGTLKVWDLDQVNEPCTHTLEGHTDGIESVAVLPDGRLVSGSLDRTLKVWDLNQLNEPCTHTLEGHANAIQCVAVLPDGRLVSGAWDNTLKVWDLNQVNEPCIRTLEGHANAIHCIAVLPGERLVSGSWDRTLKVWDLNQVNEPCTHTLEGHADAIRCIATLPDGRLVSCSRDCTLKIWDLLRLESEPCTHTQNHTEMIQCVAALPDSRLVSCPVVHLPLKVWDYQCRHLSPASTARSAHAIARRLRASGR